MIDTKIETVFLKSYIEIDPELTKTQDPPLIPNRFTKDAVEEWVAESIKIISELNLKLVKIYLLEGSVIEKQIKIEDL